MTRAPMENPKKIIPSSIAFLIAIIVLYGTQLYYPELHPLSQTAFKISRQDAVDVSRGYLDKTIQNQPFRTRVNFEIKKEVFPKNRIDAQADEPGISTNKYWSVQFMPEKDSGFELSLDSEGNVRADQTLESGYLIHLTPGGKLLKLDFSEMKIPALKDSLKKQGKYTLAEPSPGDMVPVALNHLNRLGVDTTQFTLSSTDLRQDSALTIYQYHFNERGMENGYEHIIELARGAFLSYDLKDTRQVNDSPSLLSEDTGFKIFSVIVWLGLIVLLIIFIIRLLRKEAMSFRLAIPVVILVGSISLILAILRALEYANWIQLIGGTVGVLFISLGMLILYPTAEALTRQIWPSKLVVTDSFHQRRLLTPQTGWSLLRGIFFGITALGVYTLLLLVSSGLLHIPVVLGEDLTYPIYSIFPTIMIVLDLVTGSLFHELFYRLFGLTVLKKWFKKNRWVVISGALLLPFFAIDILSANVPFKFFSFAIVGAIFAFLLVRYELFAVIVGYFTFLILSRAMVFTHTGEEYFQQLGLELYFIMGILLLAGLGTVIFKRNVHERGTEFVPGYQKKLEERQRLLRELEIARSVQQQFLPKVTPQMPGYQIAASCQPAWEVGGDYFDFFSMNNKKLGIVIGDVSNKGISAAFFMTLVKGFLKALTAHFNKPGAILCEANRLFYQNVARGHFISMIFGILDIPAGTFTFSRAGHNPLLLLMGRSGEQKLITPEGVGIGILPDDKFREHIKEEQIQLQKDDVIVLYTDGYTEAMNERLQEFEEEQFKTIIANSRTDPAEEIIRKLEDAVSTWQGDQEALDDRTLVVIRRTGQ